MVVVITQSCLQSLPCCCVVIDHLTVVVVPLVSSLQSSSSPPLYNHRGCCHGHVVIVDVDKGGAVAWAAEYNVGIR